MASKKLVMCPYDDAHKVKESRLQLHITKCRMNHLNEEKFTCPFNATHVFPRPEQKYHLLNCPDKAPLDRKMAHDSLNINNPYKGRTAVPSYFESTPIPCDEVWDIDPTHVGPGYQPPTETPSNIMFFPPSNTTPSVRKQMYQALHQRSEETTNNKPLPTMSTAPVAQQAKQPSQISVCERPVQNNYPGLGRGRGIVPSRIAANIYPAERAANNQKSGENGYVGTMSAGISQLGLGRGQAVNSSVAPPKLFDDDDDFPALGCGRGMSRAPRNNNSYASIMGNKH